MEEVDFVGGGVFFWRKCFLLEEVIIVGGHYFWSRSILLEEVYSFGGSVFLAAKSNKGYNLYYYGKFTVSMVSKNRPIVQDG